MQFCVHFLFGVNNKARTCVNNFERWLYHMRHTIEHCTKTNFIGWTYLPMNNIHHMTKNRLYNIFSRYFETRKKFNNDIKHKTSLYNALHKNKIQVNWRFSISPMLSGKVHRYFVLQITLNRWVSGYVEVCTCHCSSWKLWNVGRTTIFQNCFMAECNPWSARQIPSKEQ